MTPSSSTSAFIGLAALGSLFWSARENPLGLDAVRGGGPALELLRATVIEHGASYHDVGRRLDLGDPGVAAAGLQSIQSALFRDEPLRQRVLSLVRAESYLAPPGVIDAAIRWCQKQRERPVTSLLLSGAPVVGTPFPEASARRLVLAMKEVQSLQLIAGAALYYEGTGDLQMAGQLYKWYLIAQEQLDFEATQGDPNLLAWGRERLLAVARRRGDEGLVSRLTTTTAPLAARYERMRSEFSTVDPNEDDFLPQLEFFLQITPRDVASWREVGIEFASALTGWLDRLQAFLDKWRDGLTAEALREFEVLRASCPALPNDEVVLEFDVDFDPPASRPAGRSTWTIDVTEKRLTRAEVTDRLQRQITEMSPGDTVLILCHAQNLAELNRDKDALKAALEGMGPLDHLTGGAVILRSVDFGMQYRFTAEPAGDRWIIRTDLGPAR